MKSIFNKTLCLIISVILVIGIMPAFEIVSEAATPIVSEDGNWQYVKIRDRKIVETHYLNSWSAKPVRYLGNDTVITVPETIDNYKVFTIGEKCFYGDKISDDDIADTELLDSVKSILIGANIFDIEKEAFAYMDSLESIVFSDETPAFSGALSLKERLFKESPKLNTLEIPDSRLYYAYNNPFTDSCIQTLKIPRYLLEGINNLDLPSVKHLILTGGYDYSYYFEKYFSDNIETIEFEGFFDHSRINTNLIERFPDLVFHHIPHAQLELALEKIGYIKNYDYESGTVCFSLENEPDTKYLPITEPIVSGDYEYKLTADGKAVISDYFGSEESLNYPAVIDGYSVISIDIGEKTSARLSEIRSRNIKSINIPDGIEYIGKGAFSAWEKLENVAFPDSLKIIDGNAFSLCSSLRDISLPNIVYLGTRAFAECQPERIYIPDTLKEIPMYAFYNTGIDNLRELVIPEGVESIGSFAFKRYLNGLPSEICTEINLPSSIKYIGEEAFFNTNLSGDLIIPGSVESICCDAFAKNTNLNSLNISQGVKYILTGAFDSCSFKETIYIPNTVTRIDEEAFYSVTAPSIVLPESIKVLYTSCLYGVKLDYLYLPSEINDVSTNAVGYSVIDDLKIPKSIYRYDKTAFNGIKCNTLSFGNSYNIGRSDLFKDSVIDSLSFSEDTVEVPEGCFSNTSINKIVLNGIEWVYDSAFENCNIKNLEVSESVVTILEKAFQGSNISQKVIFNAKKCTSAPKLLSHCSEGAEFTFGEDIECIPEGLFQSSPLTLIVPIPQTVKHIYKNAFSETDITEISLPPDLELIGQLCFKDCLKLRRITIPKTVKSIGSGAFMNCESLESVTFYPVNCLIGRETENGIFSGCNNLNRIEFGNDVKYIPDYLLKDVASEIGDITIPGSVTDIGSYSFANTKIKSIIIPESVESIGDGCFENCSELETVVINGNIMLIGDNAFSGCDKIREIYISDTVKDIGKTSFSGCTSLETVYMSKNVVYIPERCFENCTALSSFTWEADSKLIGKLAFAGCTSLTTFNFIGIEKLYPNSFQGSGIGVASLGEAQDEAAAALEVVEAQSFMDCPELQTVALGGNVNTVQTRAFANCENLETAIISDSVETISSDAFENCPKLTIYCSEDSYAYNYAKSNGIPVSTFVVEPIPNQRFTGNAIEPTVKVSVSGKPLAKGEDFKVKYSDNINVGTATVKVSGINTYKMFSSIVNFAILTRDISEAEIDGIANQTYTGSEITPALRVIYNGKTLREGKDYNVIYTNNTSAGKAKATVTGIGNFSGTASVEFNIVETQNPSKNEGLTQRVLTFMKNVIAFIARIISFISALFKN